MSRNHSDKRSTDADQSLINHMYLYSMFMLVSRDRMRMYIIYFVVDVVAVVVAVVVADVVVVLVVLVIIIISKSSTQIFIENITIASCTSRHTPCCETTSITPPPLHWATAWSQSLCCQFFCLCSRASYPTCAQWPGCRLALTSARSPS